MPTRPIRSREAIIAGALALPVSLAHAQPSYTAEPVAQGLSRPVQVLPDPLGGDRLFVVEQRSGNTGRVRIIDLSDNSVAPEPFLTLTVSTGGEQGLLGLAFAPDFAATGVLYTNHTRPDGDTVILRHRVSADNPDAIDPGQTFQVLELDQPFTNHNAGWIGFGPDDGFLYIPTGDGGSFNDPGSRAQLLSSPLGKVLRIDPTGDDFPADATRNYAIPMTNPFRMVFGADPAVFALGLRNPYRCDFDPFTGDLFIADVGQDAREEISVLPAFTAGQNFGWRCFEGELDTGLGPCTSDAGLTPPVATYSHFSPDFGCSITGGIVVDGCSIPSLRGAFLSADFCSDKIYRLGRNSAGGFDFEEITSQFTPDSDALNAITSFGRDAQGRVYGTSLSGRVWRITSDEIAPAAWSAPEGSFDIFDVIAFLGAFETNADAADTNRDGLFDFFDVVEFLALADEGC
ncbi:MAG: PQQ-dependent sugar dehydrogenase [Planctomycetota bacterium]